MSKKLGETEVFIVRHGRTEWNRKNRLMGMKDIPLDETGRKQAQKAAGLISSQPVCLYTSPLKRAAETANIIGSELEIEPLEDYRLCEVDVGALAGLNYEQLKKYYPGFEKAKSQKPAETARPFGESDLSMQRRALSAFYEFTQRHHSESIVITSHGGPIKAILSAFLRMPLAEKWRLSIDNGSVSLLRFTHRGWVVSEMNRQQR